MEALAVLYGVVGYAVFFVVFLYAVGFVGNVVVPKGIEGGWVDPPIRSVTVDLGLLSIFAVQHSVMARPTLKAWWTRIVPPVIERSTYALLASLALVLVFWKWHPLPAPVWQIGGAPAMLLWALCALGWALVLSSTS